MSNWPAPTPGSVRIFAPTPIPTEAKVEMLQADGTWQPLRICGVDVMLRADHLITARILVEPSSVDILAWPEPPTLSAWQRLRRWIRRTRYRFA